MTLYQAHRKGEEVRGETPANQKKDTLAVATAGLLLTAHALETKTWDGQCGGPGHQLCLPTSTGCLGRGYQCSPGCSLQPLAATTRTELLSKQ